MIAITEPEVSQLRPQPLVNYRRSYPRSDVSCLKLGSKYSCQISFNAE